MADLDFAYYISGPVKCESQNLIYKSEIKSKGHIKPKFETFFLTFFYSLDKTCLENATAPLNKITRKGKALLELQLQLHELW